MSSRLAGFIRFLVDHGLVEFDVLGVSEAKFNNRLKLQKYVFLAEHYGLALGYRHEMYMRGPYSSKLTDDYYSLARGPGLSGVDPDALPTEFKRDDFLRDAQNDSDWLEVATTLIDKNDGARERDVLLETVLLMKSKFGKPYIDGVLRDVESRCLVSFDAAA